MKILIVFEAVNTPLDMTQATLTAMGILVSVTVFTTGFLSVRIHAERARALDRANRAEEHLALIMDTNKAISDREMDASYDALNSVETGVARAIAYGNVLVFATIVALSLEWVHHTGWRWAEPSQARPSLWALLAINSIEFAVVAVGIFDVKQVVHDVNRRKRKTYGYRMSEIDRDLRDGRLVRAQGRAICLSEELPNAASPQRALGRSYLMGKEWTKALHAFNKALACAQELLGNDNLMTWMGRARALEAIGKPEQAAADLARVVSVTEFSRSNDDILAIGPVDWLTWVIALDILTEDKKSDRVDYVMTLLLDRYIDTPGAMEATADAMSRVVLGFKAENQATFAKIALGRWRRKAGSNKIIAQRINDLIAIFRDTPKPGNTV